MFNLRPGALYLKREYVLTSKTLLCLLANKCVSLVINKAGMTYEFVSFKNQVEYFAVEFYKLSTRDFDW